MLITVSQLVLDRHLVLLLLSDSELTFGPLDIVHLATNMNFRRACLLLFWGIPGDSRDSYEDT